LGGLAHLREVLVAAVREERDDKFGGMGHAKGLGRLIVSRDLSNERHAAAFWPMMSCWAENAVKNLVEEHEGNEFWVL
jgi:hypothetical protein